MNSKAQDDEMSLDWTDSDELFKAIFGKAQIRLGKPKKDGEEMEDNAEEETTEEEEDIEGMEGPEWKTRKYEKEKGAGQSEEKESDQLYTFGVNSPWNC